MATSSIAHPRSSLIKIPGTKGTVCKSGISLMSFTEKMGCPSWGMTAKVACPMAAHKGNLGALASLQLSQSEIDRLTCNDCYADDKGMYHWKNVKLAYAERFAWAARCLRTTEGRDEFVTTMVTGVLRECARMGVTKFRIHDSGDFFNPHYIRCWIDICRQCPGVNFWAPTRSWRSAIMLPFLVQLNALPNVAISPSGLVNDGEIPSVPGLAGGSVVVTDHAIAENQGAHICRAGEHAGHCGTCMVCYTAVPRAYPLHNAQTRAATRSRQLAVAA